MKDLVYVIGHKSPDTDSVCSSIAFARLKARLGAKDIVPARAGKVNRETEFVLNYFGLKTPELLPDVLPRVKDLLNGKVPTVLMGASLQEAWLYMKQNKQKTLPVVDGEGRMKGMLTVGDISESYIGSLGHENMGSFRIPVRNALSTLGGTLLVGEEKQELFGRIRVGAMQPETMEEVIEEGNILILGDRLDAQEKALDCNLSAMVLTGGAVLSPELSERAREQGIVVISVPHDTFTTVHLLPMCVPVDGVMRTEGIVAFQADDLISEVKTKMLETRYRNYPVLDERDHVVALISRYHLLGMPRKKLILVDHNEWGQAVAGADQAQIMEVIDHHRVGGIQTGDPILFRMEPVGCTSTLIHQIYKEHGLEPEREIAGIMLAAILSDTVLFKSPTCTDKDREAADELAQLAGVDIQSFGIQMLKASSDILDKTPRELIETDLKEFSGGTPKIAVGQISVMGMENAVPIRKALQEEMEKARMERGMDYLLLMVTDLLEENTDLLIAGFRPEEVGKAFDLPLTDGGVFLKGVLSRKKQVIPPLSHYFF